MTTTTAPNILTLQKFLEKYPWPDEWLKKGKPMHFFWRFDLPVPPEKLWPYMADLSSFNKRAEMGEMTTVVESSNAVVFAWSSAALAMMLPLFTSPASFGSYDNARCLSLRIALMSPMESLDGSGCLLLQQTTASLLAKSTKTSSQIS